MKKRTAAVMTALSLALVLGGCDDKKTPESSAAATTQEATQKVAENPMTDLTFLRTTVNYRVDFSDPVTVKIQKINQLRPYDDYDTVGYYTATLELDAESASRIAALYEKHQLAKWNGFNERGTGGEGAEYSLRIVFKNGEEMKAEGDMKWPDGYGEFESELDEILKPYVDRVLAEYEEIGTFEYLYRTEPVTEASDGEKAAAEAARIEADDNIINQMDIASQTLLMDPTYFAAAEEKVVVTVSHVGVPAVTGLGDKGEDFLKELNLIVYGQETPVVLFQSKGYTRSGSTKLEYTYNTQAYTWRSSVTNEIAGSKYYLEGSGDVQETPSGSAVEVDAGTMIEIDEENFPDKIFRAYVEKHIDADQNRVLDAEEIRNTTVIDLENDPKGEDANRIYSLEGIGYFVALEKLYSCYNRLNELDLSQNTNLQVLHCTNNGLKVLNVSGCPNLKKILCYDNGLSELEISHNTKLEELLCQRNALTALDISNNTELQLLNCAHNSLTSLDISNNPKLDVHIVDQEVELQ